MDYSNLLYQIGNYTWLGYVAALLLSFWFKAGDRSYYYGTTVLVIANLVMQALEPALVELANYDRELVRAMWYPTWAACDLAAIYAIHQLHLRAKCTITFVSLSLAISFTTMCFLQGVRYFDQFVIMSNMLGEFYMVSIISINIGCLVIVFTPMLQLIQSKTKRASG